jgi:hypothetical protein
MCKICNVNSGYTLNSEYPYCSYISGKNYNFYYNSEMVNKREEYLISDFSQIPDKILLEKFKLTFSTNLKRITNISLNAKISKAKLQSKDILIKSVISQAATARQTTKTLPKITFDHNEPFYSNIKSINLNEISDKIIEKSSLVDKNKYSIWNIEPLNNFLIGISKIKVNIINEINDDFNFTTSSNSKLQIMKSNLTKTTKNNISLFNKISNRLTKANNI